MQFLVNPEKTPVKLCVLSRKIMTVVIKICIFSNFLLQREHISYPRKLLMIDYFLINYNKAIIFYLFGKCTCQFYRATVVKAYN